MMGVELSPKKGRYRGVFTNRYTFHGEHPPKSPFDKGDFILPSRGDMRVPTIK